jgi:hypothetical protein
MKEVKKGSIVAFKDSLFGKDSGHYRVTSLRGGKVNLGSVFGRGIYFKGIPLEEVYEDEAAWYENWSRSESYMCM